MFWMSYISYWCVSLFIYIICHVELWGRLYRPLKCVVGIGVVRKGVLWDIATIWTLIHEMFRVQIGAMSHKKKPFTPPLYPQHTWVGGINVPRVQHGTPPHPTLKRPHKPTHSRSTRGRTRSTRLTHKRAAQTHPKSPNKGSHTLPRARP